MSTAGARPMSDVPLPPSAGGLSRNRRVLGLAGCFVGLPLLTGVLVALRNQVALDSVLLIYLLAVVVIAVVGGIVASLTAAVASFLLANWFLTPPYYTFEVESRDRLIELVVYVVVAVLVSVTVDVGARNRVRAHRIQTEARLLSRITSGDHQTRTVEGVLEQVRQLFGLTTVALRETSGNAVLGAVGPDPDDEPTLTVPADEHRALVAHGPELFAEDRRLLRTLANAAARAWDDQRLGEQAAQARQLAETDRVRSALLATVGHDLRTPLAGIKAAVSTLRQTDLAWSLDDQQELLGGIEESTDRLTDMVTNLLAMSRIQTGAVSVHLGPVSLDEVVAAALVGLGEGSERVDVPEELPWVRADVGLLERVLANLFANARRFTPPDQPISITATGSGDVVRLAVADHGPGVAEDRWEEMFEPFQTLSGHSGDRDPSPGLGMGLAIARGLSQAMDVDLLPSRTPGGGLTMTLTFEVAR